MSITEHLIENMNKSKLDEAMNYHTSNKDIREIVKELSDNNWSTSKKAIREACKRIEELGCSDKKMAQKFVKEMDKYSTRLGKKLMKEAWDDMDDKEEKVEEKIDDGIEACQDGVDLRIAKFFVRNK